MKYIYTFALLLICLGCTSKPFKSKWVTQSAPEQFSVRFETTKGDFDIAIERQWSPKAVDRFYQQVKHHLYDESVFYRVVPGFVAQFGDTKPQISNQWGAFKVPDEEVKLGNTKGTLSFARGGKESRNAALFINLVDNSRLDTLDYNGVKGFPAFGKVIRGMDVVLDLHGGYREQPGGKLNLLYTQPEEFFKAFPKLDRILKISILKDKK
ncbi:peptidylprolyl isomerase [Spongiimicrobium salis]|uniref:peptidylprolyl isomerase n=1 Tax=Spongiimicrobium salis TaxID=1667022 RepID=UPI00374CD148